MTDLILQVLSFLIDFLSGQWGDLIANISIILFAVLKAAEVFVGWTPGTKDDQVVARIREFLEILFPEQAGALRQADKEEK